MVITSQICGRLYHTVGPRRLLVGGLAAMSVFSLGFLAVGFDTSLWVIRGIMLARGCALGFVFVPLQAAAYANIEPEDTGRATAIFAALRQIAASLGVAILATVLVESTHHFARRASGTEHLRQASLDAFHVSFFVGSCMIMAAAGAALMIHDSDAAGTMRGRTERQPVPPDMRSEETVIVE
jgi:MFS family permease